MTLWGCEQSEESKPAEEKPLEITSFRFEQLDPTVEAEIDSVNKEIHASIPRAVNIKRLTPTIEYIDGAELSPPSGYAYDFSSPLDFTLTKDERSVTYTAYVDTALSDDNQLKRVQFPKLYVNQSVDNKEITVKVPFGTDLSQVEMHLEVGAYARVEPASDTVMDLSQPVEITVTSESGKENTYTLMVEHRQQQTGVRAFWVPAPWHSPFLSSYADIQEGVNFAKEHNFNTLYIVAWSNNQILYPSQTLLDHSSYSSVEESMFGDYTGGTGDPLKDVVTLAHQAGLKVVLWYEYGFMAKVGNPPTPQRLRHKHLLHRW